MFFFKGTASVDKIKLYNCHVFKGIALIIMLEAS